jgi:hypothetical protein
MGKSRNGKRGWKTQTTEESPDSGTEPFPGGSGVNEFERESVPESSLKSLRSLVGMYAGEHTAGTQFMIGPLFVAHGVTAFDVLVGLFLGNLMAVLSWRFLCAPIAVRVRQTMYYQLERICGVRLVTLYNLANGLMFCFLAGAMVSVSATAVGIPFDMKMPGLNDWLPNKHRWNHSGKIYRKYGVLQRRRKNTRQGFYNG